MWIFLPLLDFAICSHVHRTFTDPPSCKINPKPCKNPKTYNSKFKWADKQYSPACRWWHRWRRAWQWAGTRMAEPTREEIIVRRAVTCIVTICTLCVYLCNDWIPWRTGRRSTARYGWSLPVSEAWWGELLWTASGSSSWWSYSTAQREKTVSLTKHLTPAQPPSTKPKNQKQQRKKERIKRYGGNQTQQNITNCKHNGS